MASIPSSSGSLMPTLTQAIVILASIVSATAYFFSNVFRKTLKDENGNSIPHGPIGLPIVG